MNFDKLYEGHFTGERALFMTRSAKILNSLFDSGESPLKESADLYIDSCRFGWKYPIWYSENVYVKNTEFYSTARSGIWYTDNITLDGCKSAAPKTFRRCRGVRLVNCDFENAAETLWNCRDIEIDSCRFVGDYLGMNCENVRVDSLTLDGNYLFDGGKNIKITNSRLISKDAFWNAENVVVKNCYIEGEYLGWNSKNVIFENCVIESDQGLCYMDGVTLVGCTLNNTPLAFEFSRVDAQVLSHIDSIKNPASGRIIAPSVGEIIHEDGVVDKSATRIITEKIGAENRNI